MPEKSPFDSQENPHSKENLTRRKEQITSELAKLERKTRRSISAENGKKQTLPPKIFTAKVEKLLGENPEFKELRRELKAINALLESGAGPDVTKSEKKPAPASSKKSNKKSPIKSLSDVDVPPPSDSEEVEEKVELLDLDKNIKDLEKLAAFYKENSNQSARAIRIENLLPELMKRKSGENAHITKGDKTLLDRIVPDWIQEMESELKSKRQPLNAPEGNSEGLIYEDEIRGLSYLLNIGGNKQSEKKDDLPDVREGLYRRILEKLEKRQKGEEVVITKVEESFLKDVLPNLLKEAKKTDPSAPEIKKAPNTLPPIEKKYSKEEIEALLIDLDKLKEDIDGLIQGKSLEPEAEKRYQKDLDRIKVIVSFYRKTGDDWMKVSTTSIKEFIERRLPTLKEKISKLTSPNLEDTTNIQIEKVESPKVEASVVPLSPTSFEDIEDNSPKGFQSPEKPTLELQILKSNSAEDVLSLLAEHEKTSESVSNIEACIEAIIEGQDVLKLNEEEIEKKINPFDLQAVVRKKLSQLFGNNEGKNAYRNYKQDLEVEKKSEPVSSPQPEVISAPQDALEPIDVAPAPIATLPPLPEKDLDPKEKLEAALRKADRWKVIYPEEKLPHTREEREKIIDEIHQEEGGKISKGNRKKIKEQIEDPIWDLEKEEALRELEETRKKYVDQQVKDELHKRNLSWRRNFKEKISSSLNNLGSKFGIGKEFESDETYLAKTEYLNAKKRYGNAAANKIWVNERAIHGDIPYESVEEREKIEKENEWRLKQGEELKLHEPSLYAKTEAHISATLLKDIAIREYQAITKTKEENLPTPEKKMLRKSLEWYGKQNKIVRLMGTSLLVTGGAFAIAPLIGFTPAAGFAAMFGGRVLRGALGMTLGIGTFKGSNKLFNKGIDKKAQKNLKMLEERYSVISGVEDYDESVARIEIEKRRALAKSAALAGLVGYSSALLSGIPINKFTSHIDDMTSTPKPAEAHSPKVPHVKVEKVPLPTPAPESIKPKIIQTPVTPTNEIPKIPAEISAPLENMSLDSRPEVKIETAAHPRDVEPVENIRLRMSGAFDDEEFREFKIDNKELLPKRESMLDFDRPKAEVQSKVFEDEIRDANKGKWRHDSAEKSLRKVLERNAEQFGFKEGRGLTREKWAEIETDKYTLKNPEIRRAITHDGNKVIVEKSGNGFKVRLERGTGLKIGRYNGDLKALMETTSPKKVQLDSVRPRPAHLTESSYKSVVPLEKPAEVNIGGKTSVPLESSKKTFVPEAKKVVPLENNYRPKAKTTVPLESSGKSSRSIDSIHARRGSLEGDLPVKSATNDMSYILEPFNKPDVLNRANITETELDNFRSGAMRERLEALLPSHRIKGAWGLRTRLIPGGYGHPLWQGTEKWPGLRNWSADSLARSISKIDFSKPYLSKEIINIFDLNKAGISSYKDSFWTFARTLRTYFEIGAKYHIPITPKDTLEAYLEKLITRQAQDEYSAPVSITLNK